VAPKRNFLLSFWVFVLKLEDALIIASGEAVLIVFSKSPLDIMLSGILLDAIVVLSAT
jgi:hypothetical protein